MATGAINTARQVGYAFGIALWGSVFTAGVRHILDGWHMVRADFAARASRRRPGQGKSGVRHVRIPRRRRADHHAAAAHGLYAILLVSGLLGVAAAVISLLMTRRPSPEAAEGTDGAVPVSASLEEPQPANT